MAQSPILCPTANRHALAAEEIPGRLASAQSSWPSGTTQDRTRAAPALDGCGKPIPPALAEECRRTSEARNRGSEINSGEVQTARGEIAVSNLANISRSKPSGVRHYRLLCCANGVIQHAICLPCTGARATTNRLFQWYGTSHSPVGGTTNIRCVSFRYGSPLSATRWRWEFSVVKFGEGLKV